MKKRQWVSGKWKEVFFWEKSTVMEKQIFNAIIVIIALYVLTLSGFNFFANQYLLGGILFGCIIILGYLYYLLRKKNKFHLSLLIFGCLAYPIITVNFYLNDGIFGPSSYAFILINLVLVSISPIKWIVGWTTLNICCFLGLIHIGIFHPEIFPSNYPDKTSQFLDHSFTYLASILGMTFILITIRNFYQSQKAKTEINRNELMMVNRDLTKSNFQKDKIIAIITHDLKNPLQSIVQTLELINETDDLSPEEMVFVHSELLKNTKRTYAMMENILEWSSFELNSRNRRIKDIDLISLLTDTLEIMKTIAKQKGITLRINYLCNPFLRIESDRLLLIVRNLIQNAIKFTHTGGTVTLELSQDENETVISVEDNGIGISEKKLETIFQLEVKPTFGTAMEKGTGMGLHLCYQNAQKIGGELSVKSTEGTGSNFTLRIPKAVSTAEENIKPSTPFSL